MFKFIYILFSVALCHSLTLCADIDILSDNTKTFPPCIIEPVSVDKPDSDKIRAQALYAHAYLKLQERGNRYTPEIIDQLIESLKYNPEAVIPLELAIYGIAVITPAPKDKESKLLNGLKKKWISQLTSIAKKNPELLVLNIRVADQLTRSAKYKKAISLLEKSMSKYDIETVDNEQTNRYLMNIIIKLTGLYDQLKLYSKGDELITLAKENPHFNNNFKLHFIAAIFYEKATEKATNDHWLWFTEGDKDKYRRKAGEHFDSLATISAEKTLSEDQLITVLSMYSEKGMFEQVKNLILLNLLNDPENKNMLILLAAAYQDIGEYENSLRIWRTIFKTHKIDSSYRKYYLDYANAAFMSKNYKEAVTAFKWYILFKPDNPKANYQLALTYYDMSNYEAAIKTLKQIINLPEATYLTALAYRQIGNMKKARDFIIQAEKSALTQRRNHFLTQDFYFTLAFICEKAGDIKNAEVALQKLLKHDPENAEAANFLGYIWADHNMHLDKAIKLIEIALKDKPDSSAYLDSMAWALYRQNNYRDALKFIEKALKFEGEIPDAVIADHAGDIYAALGDKDKALKYWRLALSIYSIDTDPEKIRIKINKFSNNDNVNPR